METSSDRPEILDVLGEVVVPAMKSVFRPGEVESITVAWERPISMAGPTRESAVLNVHVRCEGEEHTSNLWMMGCEPALDEQARMTLIDELQDFVAESSFGWGEQR